MTEAARCDGSRTAPGNRHDRSRPHTSHRHTSKLVHPRPRRNLVPDRRTAKAARIVASVVVGGVAAVAAVLTPVPASAAGAPIACGTVLTASITLKADLTCTGDA